jgi:hypothetical protein
MKTLKTLLLIAALSVVAQLASAQTLVYFANLSGPNEEPPNNSPGTGFATLTIDLTANTFRLQVSFSGLQGTVSAAHIHGPTANAFSGTAGVMTQTPSFSGFPHGGTSGMYDMTFNMGDSSSWNPNFNPPGGRAETFVQAVADGKAYLNIHSNLFPGGEIRGFFMVPEPGTTALFAAGGAGLLILLRRKRST